ncbi:MAG TPA: hypothetical protein VFB32_04620 [Rudaea sp.]|jgi:hypothetical protein|nr:hypothetical protein [Rudaea sp.]
MRTALVVIGLVLLFGGGAAFFGVVQYPHDKEVVKIGNLSASVSQERTVPQWIGGVAALVGIGLIAAGTTRR